MSFDFRRFLLLAALLLLIALTYYRLPWRKLPEADAEDTLMPATPVVEPSLPAPQSARLPQLGEVHPAR